MALEQYYSTRDLGLAAALITIGYEVSELEHWKDAAFTFHTNVDFVKGKEHERDYYRHILTVPAKAYGDCIRALRGRAHDEARKLGL